MNIDKEREAFEAWATSKGWNTKRAWTNERVYASSEVNQLWDSWQARAALDEQKAGPSDEEIEALAKQHLWAHAENVGAGNVYVEGEVAFARALLSKYAAPVPKGEPVHQVFHSDGRWEDIDAEARANCEDHGKETRTLYAAPVNEQDAKDAPDIADFVELIDDYQCAQLDGDHDARAAARHALVSAYRAALKDAQRYTLVGYFYRWELDRSLKAYPEGFPGAVPVFAAIAQQGKDAKQ